MNLVQMVRSWLGLTRKCARRGRELTSKESIRRGYGPECRKAYLMEIKKEVEFADPPIPFGEIKKEIEENRNAISN